MRKKKYSRQTQNLGRYRHRLEMRNRLVQRRIAAVLPSYTYVGMFRSSSGPCSHGTGFDNEVPTWLRSEIVSNGRKVWRLWPPGGFLDDLGDLLLGSKVIKVRAYSYLLVYGIRDHDDFTDFEAKVYKQGSKAIRKWRQPRVSIFRAIHRLIFGSRKAHH